MEKYAHGGNIHAYFRANTTKKLLDFSANINPAGLSGKIKKAIINDIDNIIHYPDIESYELKKAISEYYDLPKEKIVLGNGATEVLYTALRTLNIKKIILPVPSFNEYEKAAFSSSIDIEYFYLSSDNNFFVDCTVLSEEITEGSLTILCNPNNPTGQLLNKEQFGFMLQQAKIKKGYIFVDESFIDFRIDERQESVRSFCAKYDNLFILHSLTKFFAIPGLRLGFGVFPSEIADKIRFNTDTWNVNSLAQTAGIVGLKDNDYILKSKSDIIDLRNNFMKQLEKFSKILVYPSSVNFLLLNIEGLNIDSKTFCKLFYKHGILVRDCSNFIGLNKYYVRIAVRTENENNVFIEILNKVIGEII